MGAPVARPSQFQELPEPHQPAPDKREVKCSAYVNKQIPLPDSVIMWIKTASPLLRHARIFSAIARTLRNYAHQVTVDPFCKIRVKTSCPLVLRPFNLLDNPANNHIKATLTKNQTELDIKLEDGEDQQVVTISEKLTKFMGQDEILLEVPVQVDVDIEGSETVSLSGIESDSIVVYGMKGIQTKNIKGQDIELTSGAGVQCQGTLLAKKLTIRAEQDGVSTG